MGESLVITNSCGIDLWRPVDMVGDLQEHPVQARPYAYHLPVARASPATHNRAAPISPAAVSKEGPCAARQDARQR